MPWYKMADTTNCRRPQLQVTDTIRKSIEKTVKCKCVSAELKKQCADILQQDTEESVISTKLIRDIYSTLRVRNEGHKVFLHELVEDAQLIPQTVSLPPRNPELEARIRKLKIEQENKEYERMTRRLQPAHKRTFTFQEEVKSLNRQIVFLINFVVTVLAGFAFGYKGTEILFGKLFPMQMLSGLVLATVVFFVDLYFLLKYGF